MEPLQYDGASQATQHTEQGQIASNLSTRPNMFDHNDPLCQGVPSPLEGQSQDNPARLTHNSIHTERQANNPSQNKDQINNSTHVVSSGLPHQRQSQELQQERNTAHVLISTSVQKRFQLTTFNEDWEHQLKEEQAEGEKFHELINSDNDPLLSQRSEPQFDFLSNNQLLLTQQDKAEDSNQVKFNKYGVKQSEVIDEQSIHKSQTSSKHESQQYQPLFQLGVKQESQSNLLNFGFSLKKGQQRNQEDHNSQRKNIQSQPKNPQSQSSSRSSIHQRPIQIQNSQRKKIQPQLQIAQIQSPTRSVLHQRPIQIQSSQRKNTQPQPQITQRQSPSRFVLHQRPIQIQQYGHFRTQQSIYAKSNYVQNDDVAIKIQVNDCNSQMINNASKDNDIYGISNPLSKSPQKNNQQQIVQDYNEATKQENKQQEEHRANITVQQKYQENCKKQVEEANLLQQNVEPPLKKYPQQRSPQIHVIKEASSSLEEIKQHMQQIIKGGGSQRQRAQLGVKILRDHIDLLFVVPISDIGRQIMIDGKTAVNLIEVILLKETDNLLKQILQKYLILTLVSKIQRNQQDLIDYQQASAATKNSSTLIKNLDRSIPAADFSIHCTNVTLHESAISSIHAENGSTAQKSPNGKIDIQNSEREPVKRTIIIHNMVVEPVRQSPTSGKVTRKTRYKSNKGKTSFKKNTVKFETQSNDSEGSVDGLQQKPKKKQSKKRRTKSSQKAQINQLKSDSVSKNPHHDQLGSKFTYHFLRNNRSNKKQLVQCRASQRLAEKNSAAKNQVSLDDINSSKNQRRSSQRSSQRLSQSSKKKYEEEELDIDYIKTHLREIKIKTSMMEYDYDALTPEDREINDLIRQFQKIAEDEEAEQNQLPNYTQQSSHAYEPQDNTASMRSQTNSVKYRREQFKRNLSKYKVGNIPIIIVRIVDPDINKHGIYALLQLGKLSQIVYSARFALTPITNLSRACKRFINEDLEEAKRQVGEQQNNLVYMQPTEGILKQIKVEKQRRNAL